MKRNLLDEFAMALNGDDWVDARSIYDEIVATGDSEMIEKADKMYRVI